MTARCATEVRVASAPRRLAVVAAFAAAQQAPQRVEPHGQRAAAVVLADPRVEAAVLAQVGAPRRAVGEPLGEVGERRRDPFRRDVALIASIADVFLLQPADAFLLRR